jgi:hypothetical protein
MKYLYILQLLSCERGAIPVLASTKEFESFSVAADNAEKEASAFFAFYQNDAMCNDKPPQSSIATMTRTTQIPTCSIGSPAIIFPTIGSSPKFK